MVSSARAYTLNSVSAKRGEVQGNRRMTRLTNAFSKKWGNHQASLALTFAYYNFCRVHQTTKMTPAQKAGLTDHQWTIEELVRESSTH